MTVSDNLSAIEKLDRIYAFRDANYQRRWTDKPKIGAVEFVKVSEYEIARSIHRWNVDRHGENLAVCRNEHHKGDPCEWETFVPLARAEAAEARVAELEAALDRAPDGRHFDILAEALAEVKATSDGQSDQSIADIVAGCLDEIAALPPRRARTLLNGGSDERDE